MLPKTEKMHEFSICEVTEIDLIFNDIAHATHYLAYEY